MNGNGKLPDMAGIAEAWAALKPSDTPPEPSAAPPTLSLATLREQIAVHKALEAQLLGRLTMMEAYQDYVRQTGVVKGMEYLLALAEKQPPSEG